MHAEYCELLKVELSNVEAVPMPGSRLNKIERGGVMPAASS
jgi:hypothetical protein